MYKLPNSSEFLDALSSFHAHWHVQINWSMHVTDLCMCQYTDSYICRKR